MKIFIKLLCFIISFVVVGNKYFDPQGIYFYPLKRTFFIFVLCYLIISLYLIIDLIQIVNSLEKGKEISKHFYINFIILIVPFIIFGLNGFSY